MRYMMVVVGLALAGPGAAQGGTFLSADGSEFQFEKNRHGAVLTSIPPQGETVFSGGVPQFAPGEVLYLGRSCDAYARRFGDGTWNATEDGVLVDFGEVRLAFPGQQMDVTSGDRCRM